MTQPVQQKNSDNDARALAVISHLGPQALLGGKMSVLQAFELGWGAHAASGARPGAPDMPLNIQHYALAAKAEAQFADEWRERALRAEAALAECAVEVAKLTGYGLDGEFLVKTSVVSLLASAESELAVHVATADDAGPDFTIDDADLDDLLNLTSAMLNGRGNHDVGMAWLGSLEAVMLRLNAAPVSAHADDQAVDRLAVAMKAKLAAKRAAGAGGWDDPAQCPAGRLQSLLISHLAKGDPVDVANFAMMLFSRGEKTTAPVSGPAMAYLADTNKVL